MIELFLDCEFDLNVYLCIKELFTDKICKNNKLNLFNLIEKVCKQHFENISGKELKGN